MGRDMGRGLGGGWVESAVPSDAAVAEVFDDAYDKAGEGMVAVAAAAVSDADD